VIVTVDGSEGREGVLGKGVGGLAGPWKKVNHVGGHSGAGKGIEAGCIDR
jgi:hypothetical protein